MPRVFHRRAPKGHHGVANVFVQRALVGFAYHLTHGGQVGIDQVRQLMRAQALGDRGKPPHIGKQNCQLTLHRHHRESARVLGHLLDQFRRNIVAKQVRDLPHATALHKKPIGHLVGKQAEQTGQWRGQGQQQLLLPQQRAAGGEQCGQSQHAHAYGVTGFAPQAPKHQQAAQQQHREQLQTLGVGRAVQHPGVQHARDQVGMHLHARKADPEGRCHQIGQSAG